MFCRGGWHKLAPGQAAQGNSGNPTPAGLEDYLEEISVLSIPQDMPQLLAIPERYGVAFAL